MEKLPNTGCGFVAIHKRHVAVHENQLITALFQAIPLNVVLDVLLNELNGCLARSGLVTQVLGIYLNLEFKHNDECIDVE